IIAKDLKDDEKETLFFDHHDDPSFLRPPPEPPDVETFFEPNSGVLTTNVVKDTRTKCSNLEPIVKSSSPTLTSFGESDFFLEEIKDFLNDDSIPTGIENYLYDPEGDIIYLEKLLNEDPFQLPLMDLKQVEETKAKSSIEEVPIERAY
nr:reverse transcriptase domain-containing protein [Tanacetum cinerariifolium]